MFFAYAFLGWCSEVGFAAVKHGKFVNRGFLNGPICPIYGFGVVLVILALTPLSDNLPVLVIGSMLLTTALEFLTGWILEKVFHAKWWDYSGNRFNVKGYICLEFSLIWGFAATFVMKLVHPAVFRLINAVPHVLGLVLLVTANVLTVIDLVVTVATIHNLQKRLKILNTLAGEIHDMSDRIGDAISETVLSTQQRVSETAERYDEYRGLCEKHRAAEKMLVEANRAEEAKLLATLRAEGRERKAERQEASRRELQEKLGEIRRLQRRILNAFPNLKIPQNQEILDKLREVQNERRKRKQ